MKKSIFLIIVSLLLASCKTTYNTQSFDATVVPAAPDYSNSKYWAVISGQYPESLKEIATVGVDKNTDVFFVYPTLLTDKKDPLWNADVNRADLRKAVIELSVKYQASAFAKAGNLYVPFYRQSHYKIYVPPYDKEEKDSRMIAYQDVKTAFEYYLEHYNQGRPIIIASHSQGSIMCGMLLQEFFDGTPLQKQLVAAYVPGVKFQDDKFKNLKKMDSPLATGGYVSWNTYKRNNYPSSYEKWYKGATTTNPVTWDNKTETTFDQHLGVLNTDGKIYPNALRLEVVDGLIWSSVPKIPKRFFLSFVKNYHFADINLFWKNIEQNAVRRVNAWYQKNKADAR